MRLLADASFEALAVHEGGRILAANTAFIEMFGYEPPEVIGMEAPDFAAKESRQVVIETLSSSREEAFRATARRRDGSTFVVEVRGKAVRYSGRWVQVAGIRDLTAQMEAENAILELEERAVRVVEGLPAAVVMYDSKGMPKYANGLFEELTGTRIGSLGQEVTAERLSQTFHLYEADSQELYPGERSPLVKALAGVVSTAEDMEVRHAGRTVPVEVSAAPIFDQSGELQYAVAVFKDITRRRKAERAHRAALESYRSGIENAVDGVFQSTPDGTFITVNTSMARMWGYDRPAEMIADIDDLSRNYVQPGARDDLKRRMESDGAVQGFVAQIRRRDGSVIWTSITARAVRDEAGAMLYFEGRMSDITERREAAQAIADSEERYRTLVEMSPDTIALVDFNFKIVAANRQAAVMFGFEEKSDLEGSSALARVAPEERVHLHDEIMQAIQGETAMTGEYTLQRRSGERFPAELSVAPVQSAGKAESFIVVIRDVTRRKESEEALRKMNAELDGYARTVSHDLKNPLAAVRMGSETLELLLRQPDTPENRDFIRETAGSITRSSMRAIELIEDLLVLAEAGQEPGDIERVDVGEVVGMVLEERSSDIAGRGITVNIAGGLGSLEVNRTHAYQVFSNLIGNAIIHCDSPHPEIHISMTRTDGGPLLYRVRDNGSGIPEDMLDSVFLPFSKGLTGRTGIGLAIVEKIVKAYDGEVTAYNDGGAVFEVAFAGELVAEESEAVT